MSEKFIELPKEEKLKDDLVEPENSYNIPSFVEDFEDYQIEADNAPGGELGELMEKHGLEDWELKDQAKECLKYHRGERPNPFKDENKTKEILDWYLDYLTTENEHGLAFSQEELSRLTESEQKNLAALYEKRINLKISIAELNNNIRDEADIIRAGQAAGDYSTQVADGREKLKKFKSTGWKLSQLIKKTEAEICCLEEKALTDPIKQAELEKEKEYQEVLSKKTEYSLEDVQTQLDCLDYLKRTDQGPKKQPIYLGKKLSYSEILAFAREAAVEEIKGGEMTKKVFFAEEFKGRRQLASIEKFYDKKSKSWKRIKYICVSSKLPAGNYAFKMDPASMFITKNNPNSAMVHVNLMVNLDKKKEEIEAEKKELKV